MAPKRREYGEMVRGRSIGRREFLTGALRPRGTRQKVDIFTSCTGYDSTVPSHLPEIPDWENGKNRILEQLEDWTGIEDP